MISIHKKIETSEGICSTTYTKQTRSRNTYVLKLTTDDHTLMIGKQVKQERAQGGCLGTESLRKT